MNSPYPKTTAWLRALRDRSRRRFSPSRHLRRSDGLERLSEGGAGHEWIVARELCAYTLFDASAVPAGKRRGYAATAMTRWSPFADSQFHVEWAGATAMAWVWSRGRVLGGDDPMQLADPPRRLVPESLYRARPEADGEQLVAMDRGYEGRIWRDHRLVASEWWPGLPALGDWNLFRRGGGLAPVDALPDINEGTLADSTWSAPRTLGLAEVATRHRSLLAAMAIGVVVAVLAMQLVAAISLRVSIWQVENQIAVQDEGLQRILAAREAAGRDVDAIESLLALRPPAGQVELLATVIDLLPASGWRMLEWRMPDVGTLEVDLFMPNPDPSALVQAWEASGRFEAVTVELGSSPDEVSIRAGVVRAPATRGAP